MHSTQFHRTTEYIYGVLARDTTGLAAAHIHTCNDEEMTRWNN